MLPDFNCFRIQTSRASISIQNGKSNAAGAGGAGDVEVDVNVDSKFTLGDSSLLNGNLQAATLTIEEGAKFDGVCNMRNNKASKITTEN